jgi:multicomponent Na+:H+ antiporter subunit G
MEEFLRLAVFYLSWACLTAGALLCVCGALGLIRFPDVYTRMHAAGVIDTGGAALILIGLMLQAGWSLITVKLLIILFFLLFTSPTATHALAKSARTGKITPWASQKTARKATGQ